MQPGDNFRVGASFCQNELDDWHAAQNDGLLARVLDVSDVAVSESQITSLLTVWRRLHVELDSMGPGTDGTTVVSRNIDDTGTEDAHASGHTWGEINNWDEAEPEGRLEGGTLTVSGGGTYGIVDNVYDFGDDSIFVDGDIRLDEDKVASASDDDAPFVPRKPNISLMNTKFEPAYIVIQEHPEQSNLDLPFLANLPQPAPGAASATAPGRNEGFLTSSSFWTVQIVTCYQGPTATDHDPAQIYHFWTLQDHKIGDPSLFGLTPPPFEQYDNFSVIFLETIRDRAAWLAWAGPLFSQFTQRSLTDIETTTVCHEVAHVLLGNVSLGGPPGDEIHAPSGLMQNGANDPSLQFRPEELALMRTNLSPVSTP